MKRKTLFIGFACVSLAFIATFFASNSVFARTFLDTETAPDEDVVIETTLNPEWEYYQTLSESEQSEYEVVPEKYLYEYTEAPEVNTTFAASYNLNDYNLVSSVQNQGTLGICWAFATNLSLESYLLKNDSSLQKDQVTFSVRQIDYATASDGFTAGYTPLALTGLTSRRLTEGATQLTPFMALFSGYAPVSDDQIDIDYDDTSTKSFSDIFSQDKIEYTVDGFQHIPSIADDADADTRAAWVDKIKSHITNYGAITISTLGPQTYYGGQCVHEGGNYVLINATQTTNNCRAENLGYHMMSIIGWNDNYTYSYCKKVNQLTGYGYTDEDTNCVANGGTLVTGQGAFILQNSWGTGHKYTYPYLAYSSYVWGLYGVTSVSEKNWDNSYLISNSTSHELSDSTWVYRTNNDLVEDVVTFKRSNDTSEKVDHFSIAVSSSQITGSGESEVYIGSDATNLVSIGKIYPTTGGAYSIYPTNDLVLNSDTIYIKILSTDNYIYNVALFTQYTSSSATTTASFTNDELSYDITQGSQTLSLNSVTRNLTMGSRMNYAISKGGQNYNSGVYFSSDENFNNFSYAKVIVTDNLALGNYTITSSLSGQNLDTASLNVYLPDFALLNIENVSNTYLVANLSSKETFLSKFSVGSLTVDVDEMKTGQTVTLKNSSQNVVNEWKLVVLGDVNRDGKINSADLLKIRQHLLGTVVATDENYEAANVVRGGSVINSADLLALRRYLLGYITSF